MSEIKAALFDFDMTLVDSSWGIAHCTNEFAKLKGLRPVPRETVMAAIGLTIIDSWKMYWGEFHQEWLEEYRTKFRGEERKMMRLFPDLFKIYDVLPVNHYPAELRKTLELAAPQGTEHPKAVLFTPGIYNSAYFEHAFLAYEMGIELVQGQDLFVDDDDCVYMRTIRGPEKVDVIYRRIDDRFLDPETFRKDSLLGCPGLYRAAMKKNVTLVNAIGNGVADDKSVYPYVPDMIEFYLGEKPILSNVPTYTLSKSDDFKYVLEHLNELVVKEKHGSGGYGMLVGPKATKAETEEFKERIKQNPDNYIAQPTLALSTCPTVQEEGLSPRHVDLRPYALMQSPDKVVVVPGALTRVALKKGSLVVNSSQGGGTKDTWVLGKTEGDGQC